MNFSPTGGDAVSAIDYANQYVRRNAWIITTENWFNKGKFIALPLNPEQIDFNIPLRVAHDSTHAAKFIYVWRRRRTYNVMGSFSVGFNISSGNILPAFDISTADKLRAAQTFTGAAVPPSAAYAADATRGQRIYQQPDGGGVKVNGLYDKVVPVGVQNLYALLGLVEDVNAFDTGNGFSSNRVIVGMSTLAFPQLLLYGNIAPDGITFSMSADNPAEFTCSFNLLVQASHPNLGYDSWSNLVRTYKSTLFSRTQTIDWMNSIIRNSTATSGTAGAAPASASSSGLDIA